MTVMTRGTVIEWLGRLLDVTVTHHENYCDEYRVALREAVALLRVPQGERVASLERQWYEENLRYRGLGAKLARVRGLLDQRSVGRLPQCKLCDVCAGMLRAALAEPDLAAQMAADPEFVRRAEEGWKALDEGRCTSLDEVKKKLGDKP